METELKSDDLKQRTNIFINCVQAKIGNVKEPICNNIYLWQIYYDTFDDPIDNNQISLPYREELHQVKLEEVNENYLESLDEYINAEVIIPNKEEIPILTKVKHCKRDSSGKPVSKANPNTILDTRICKLQFPGGRIEEYAINMIAENLFQ